jgi:hypothetical protein
MEQKRCRKNGTCLCWTVGCGFLLLLAGIAFGTGLFFLFKWLGGSSADVRRMAEVWKMEGTVINQSTFSPPSDRLMSLEQVESLVYVQACVRDAVGSEFEAWSASARELAKTDDSGQTLEELSVLIRNSAQLMMPLHRAKQAQVDAINKRELSLQEYRWLREEAARSLGMDFSGASELLPERGGGPDLNRELLSAHRELLMQTLPLSAIGL